jgi:hypothetical protein
MNIAFPPGTLYGSYIRFSEPEQLKVDSLRRQQEAEQWAEELGLTRNESLRDLGLSAYSGAHREEAKATIAGPHRQGTESGVSKLGRSILS